jgi:hypothetical protein
MTIISIQGEEKNEKEFLANTRMQACTKCTTHPNFHHFEYLGQTSTGRHIYYTKPYPNIETKFTEETMNNYLWHMEASKKTPGPFVWVFDAHGIDKYEIPKIKLMKEFYGKMREEYKETMERVYILNSNMITRLIMKMVEPFLKSENRGKIKTISSRSELVGEGMGMEVVTKVWK